jgi:hypothetical protein
MTSKAGRDDRRMGTIAFLSLGLLLGALVPFGIAFSGRPIGLAVGLGVAYALFTAAVFGYVAWRSYEPPITVADTPSARRLAARSAVAMITARLIWYVGVVLIAITVVPTEGVLGIVLITVLGFVSLVTSIFISSRLQRKVALPHANEQR